MRRNNLLTMIFVLSAVWTSAVVAQQTEILGEFQSRPGNPAIGPDGTVYYSMHPFDQPKHKVMKLVDGKGVPFPNEEISAGFASVIGIWAESNGIVWMLDMGSPATSPQLLGWDTKAEKIAATHYLPKHVSVENSFHQDLVIDEKRRIAFIADMTRGGMIDASNPAIVAVDLNNGQTRRVLSGYKLFQPVDGATMVAEGKPMLFKDDSGEKHPVELGLNPIAIDSNFEWVYFSTMNPGKLYRINAEILGDFTVSDEDIAAAIEEFADKPSCDGIAADAAGRVFITNVEKGAISVANNNGTKIWFQDDRIIWPDGLAIAPDGSVVVTVNQLSRAAPFNDGTDGAKKPFLIMKIKAEGESTTEQSNKSDTIVVLASEAEWQQLNPKRGDQSPQAATLWGDRNGTEATGFLVKFVDGFSSPPHIHNVSYRGVVIGGGIHNDDPDAKPMWMPAGSFWTQPAGEVHITASRGAGIAYIEIEKGPYLVLPAEEASDNGERPVNVDPSNVVWQNASNTSWITQPKSSKTNEPEIAFLWGNPEDGKLNGTLVKLPVGFDGEIRSQGETFKAVVIEGRLGLQLSNDSKSLTPGSYFASTGNTVHQVSCKADQGCIVYVRSHGRFGIFAR